METDTMMDETKDECKNDDELPPAPAPAEEKPEDTDKMNRLKEIQTWWEIPAIAHFCSLFKAVFGFGDFDIEDLEEALITSPVRGGSTLVLDIICQLLNGCYARNDIKYFNYDLFLKDIFKQRWVVELGRPSPVASCNFLELSVRERVEVLHALCDLRLDADDVADMLKGLSGDSLRVDPLGVDGKGAKYWYFYGTRLYKESPDEEELDFQKSRKKGRQSSKQEIVSEKDVEDVEGDAECDENCVEEDGAPENVERLKRNPSLTVSKPCVTEGPDEEEENEGENGDMEVCEVEEIEDVKEDTDDDEETFNFQDQIYESDDEEEEKNDDQDSDFEEELMKKKKKKSPTKKKPKQTPKQKSEREPDTTCLPDEDSTTIDTAHLTIEDVIASKSKKKGRSRSRSTGKGKGRSDQKRSASRDAAKSEDSGENVVQRRKRVKKETIEATPRRKSRRRGGGEDDEAEKDLSVSNQSELKRLAIDGFQNQLTVGRRGRKKDTASNGLSDAQIEGLVGGESQSGSSDHDVVIEKGEETMGQDGEEVRSVESAVTTSEDVVAVASVQSCNETDPVGGNESQKSSNVQSKTQEISGKETKKKGERRFPQPEVLSQAFQKLSHIASSMFKSKREAEKSKEISLQSETGSKLPIADQVLESNNKGVTSGEKDDKNKLSIVDKVMESNNGEGESETPIADHVMETNDREVESGKKEVENELPIIDKVMESNNGEVEDEGREGEGDLPIVERVMESNDGEVEGGEKESESELPIIDHVMESNARGKEVERELPIVESNDGNVEGGEKEGESELPIVDHVMESNDGEFEGGEKEGESELPIIDHVMESDAGGKEVEKELPIVESNEGGEKEGKSELPIVDHVMESNDAEAEGGEKKGESELPIVDHVMESNDAEAEGGEKKGESELPIVDHVMESNAGEKAEESELPIVDNVMECDDGDVEGVEKEGENKLPIIDKVKESNDGEVESREKECVRDECVLEHNQPKSRPVDTESPVVSSNATDTCETQPETEDLSSTRLAEKEKLLSSLNMIPNIKDQNSHSDKEMDADKDTHASLVGEKFVQDVPGTKSVEAVDLVNFPHSNTHEDVAPASSPSAENLSQKKTSRRKSIPHRRHKKEKEPSPDKEECSGKPAEETREIKKDVDRGVESKSIVCTTSAADESLKVQEPEKTDACEAVCDNNKSDFVVNKTEKGSKSEVQSEKSGDNEENVTLVIGIEKGMEVGEIVENPKDSCKKVEAMNVDYDDDDDDDGAEIIDLEDVDEGSLDKNAEGVENEEMPDLSEGEWRVPPDADVLKLNSDKIDAVEEEPPQIMGDTSPESQNPPVLGNVASLSNETESVLNGRRAKNVNGDTVNIENAGDVIKQRCIVNVPEVCRIVEEEEEEAMDLSMPQKSAVEHYSREFVKRTSYHDEVDGVVAKEDNRDPGSEKKEVDRNNVVHISEEMHTESMVRVETEKDNSDVVHVSGGETSETTLSEDAKPLMTSSVEVRADSENPNCEEASTKDSVKGDDNLEQGRDDSEVLDVCTSRDVVEEKTSLHNRQIEKISEEVVIDKSNEERMCRPFEELDSSGAIDLSQKRSQDDNHEKLDEVPKLVISECDPVSDDEEMEIDVVMVDDEKVEGEINDEKKDEGEGSKDEKSKGDIDSGAGVKDVVETVLEDVLTKVDADVRVGSSNDDVKNEAEVSLQTESKMAGKNMTEEVVVEKSASSRGKEKVDLVENAVEKESGKETSEEGDKDIGMKTNEMAEAESVMIEKEVDGMIGEEVTKAAVEDVKETIQEVDTAINEEAEQMIQEVIKKTAGKDVTETHEEITAAIGKEADDIIDDQINETLKKDVTKTIKEVNEAVEEEAKEIIAEEVKRATEEDVKDTVEKYSKATEDEADDMIECVVRKVTEENVNETIEEYKAATEEEASDLIEEIVHEVTKKELNEVIEEYKKATEEEAVEIMREVVYKVTQENVIETIEEYEKAAEDEAKDILEETLLEVTKETMNKTIEEYKIATEEESSQVLEEVILKSCEEDVKEAIEEYKKATQEEAEQILEEVISVTTVEDMKEAVEEYERVTEAVANEILEEVMYKFAEENVNEAIEEYKKAMEEESDQILDEVVSKLTEESVNEAIEEYKKAMEEESNQILDEVVSKLTEENVNEAIEEYKKAMEEESDQILDEVVSKLTEENVNETIEEYKKAMEEERDQILDEVVSKLTEENMNETVEEYTQAIEEEVGDILQEVVHESTEDEVVKTIEEVRIAIEAETNEIIDEEVSKAIVEDLNEIVEEYTQATEGERNEIIEEEVKKVVEEEVKATIKEEEDRVSSGDKNLINGDTVQGDETKKVEIKEEVKQELDEKSVLDKSAPNESKTKEKQLLSTPEEVPLYPDVMQKSLFTPSSRWQLVCNDMEQWTALSQGLRASYKEKQLAKIIKEDFLPVMPSIIEDMEKAKEKRAQEMMPKRSSYRLELKKLEEEEHERHRREAEEEEEKQRAIFEEERRQQMKEEEERKQREDRERARQERARRAQLREERAQLIAEGKEIPPELMNGIKQDEAAADQEEVEELAYTLRRVLDNLKDKEFSWPFWEAVEENNTSDYFDVISEPMDLLQIERKLEERGYKDVDDFERHVNLVFDNCLEYHGKDSDFGYMAENLKGIFERSMRRAFRVYVDSPAPKRERSSYYSDYFPCGSRRSQNRPSYKEDSDSDQERKGKVMYPSGRKWGQLSEAERLRITDPDFKPEKEDDESDLRPRATWSYRRELHGMDASDFEAYIPGKKPKTETPTPVKKTVDLSKFAGAKFRYAEEVINPKSRSMPKLVINEYVTKPKTSKPPVVVKQSTPAIPPGVKVVRISKEEYAKLLAEKKITVVDGSSPSGQKIKLQAGLQLKATTVNPATLTTQSSPQQQLPAPNSAPSPSSDIKPSTVNEGKDPAKESSDSSNDLKSPVRDNASTNPSHSKPESTKKNKNDPFSSIPSSGGTDIKTRLREIKDRMESKLKSNEKVEKVEAVYENSKVVNGETIFNVAPHKMDSEMCNAFGNKRRRASYQASRYMVPSAQRIAAELEKRQRGEMDGGMMDDLQYIKSEMVRDEDDPPKKRVRFVDECVENDEEGMQVAELNQRLWTEGDDGKERKDKPESKSLSSPKESIYEKWRSKAKRTIMEAAAYNENSSEPPAKILKPAKKEYTMLHSYRPSKKHSKKLLSENKVDEGLEQEADEGVNNQVKGETMTSCTDASLTPIENKAEKMKDNSEGNGEANTKPSSTSSSPPSSSSSLSSSSSQPSPLLQQSQSSSSSSSSVTLPPSQASSASSSSSAAAASSSSPQSSLSSSSEAKPSSSSISAQQNKSSTSSSSSLSSSSKHPNLTQHITNAAVQKKSFEEDTASPAAIDSPGPLSPPKLEPIEPLYPYNPNSKHSPSQNDQGHTATTSSGAGHQPGEEEEDDEEEVPCLDNFDEADDDLVDNRNNDNNVDDDSEMPILIPDQFPQPQPS